MNMCEININEIVYVFLTDSGKQIVDNENVWNLQTPKYDKKTGLYSEQLWVLMKPENLEDDKCI